MMKKALLTGLTGLCLFCSPFANAQEVNSPLRASLLDSSGKVTGTAIFNATPKGVLVNVDIAGVSPGWHGVHFHAVGDCSDHADHFVKAGGHAARGDEQHGYFQAQGPHSGDLPNLWVHGDGTGKAEFYTAQITYENLRDADGSALMIHAATDDYSGQPAGNAGARVACGVIGR